MLSRRTLAVLVPAAALFVGAAAFIPSNVFAADKKASAKAEGGMEGKPAPEITLKTLDGKNFVLSAEKKNVVVLDFWATWCPPCRKSLPHVQELSKNEKLFKEGLRVVAVNSAEENKIVQDFMKTNNYSFVVAMDKGKASQDYGVRGIPTTVVVGRDGNVKNVFVGFGEGSAERLDKAIEAALAEK